MSSPDLQTVVIACPNCGTRYQVPFATIGAAGREVQCAQCTKHWHATADAPPPPAIENDLLFSSAEESEMDAAFEAEARGQTAPAPNTTAAPLPAQVQRDADHAKTLADIRAALAPKPKKQPVNALDPALLTKSKRAFDLRQKKVAGKLPMARVRRTARLGAFVLLLSILMLGFALRTDLVRWLPALAGLYASIGLPVNVIGLEFDNSKTMTTFRGGKPVMIITSRIRSVASTTVGVPPVLVSLLDGSGTTVYEWTVTPLAHKWTPARSSSSRPRSTRPRRAPRPSASALPIHAPALPPLLQEPCDGPNPRCRRRRQCARVRDPRPRPYGPRGDRSGRWRHRCRDLC